MMVKKIDVYNQEGEVVSSLELDPLIFDGRVNTTLIHQAVRIYLDNQRQGTACTKTRGEVKGGGRKPWRQKGTGRARVGSIRSPLWVKGGVVFGPKPRDYHKKFPKRMKNMALKSALNAKFNDGEMMLLEKVEVSAPKTKEFYTILKNLNLVGEKIKLVLSSLDEKIKLASNNIKKVKVITCYDVNTYNVLDCKKIVFTLEALEYIQKRIKKWVE